MTDDELRRLITAAIADPGAFVPRGDDYTEPIPSWGARAVMSLLEPARRSVTYKAKPGWSWDPKRRVAWRTADVPGDRGVCAGNPAFMARSDGPLIEIPGEVLYRFVDPA